MVPRARRGQGLVEAALVFVVLVVMTLGLIDFSRAWLVNHRLRMTAREGARTAVLFKDLVANDDRVLEHLREIIEGYDLHGVVVDVEFDRSPNPDPGEPVTVTVSLKWPLIYGKFLGLERGNINLSGVAVLPQER